MKRFLEAFGLFSLILFFAACKKDDNSNIAPPRDYGVQYVTDKAHIETYLKTHYITVDETTMDAELDTLVAGNGHVSIWDNTLYPLKSKMVNKNDVDYTLYYLSFREGVNKRPSSADNIMVPLRGWLLDGTQFEYQPYPDEYNPLPLFKVLGFPELMPLFKSGTFTDVPGEPVVATDFGAGIMFVPSGLAYFNGSPSNTVPPYSPMIFTFKLYDVIYTDLDKDGILNKDETVAGVDIEDYDTDGDEVPNYLDTDDDNDGRLTKDELRKPGTTNEYYAYEDLFNEDGTLKDEFKCTSTSTVPKYLDPACKGGL